MGSPRSCGNVVVSTSKRGSSVEVSFAAHTRVSSFPPSHVDNGMLMAGNFSRTLISSPKGVHSRHSVHSDHMHPTAFGGYVGLEVSFSAQARISLFPPSHAPSS